MGVLCTYSHYIRDFRFSLLVNVFRPCLDSEEVPVLCCSPRIIDEILESGKIRLGTVSSRFHAPEKDERTGASAS